MAKKNKPPKKHRFKYAEPGDGAEAVQPAAPISQPARMTAGRTSAGVSADVSATVAGRDFSYIGYDLRRIGIFATSLVILELLLWYLMGHTSFGSSIYSLIHV